MEGPLFQDLILQILQLSSGVILVVNFNGVLPGISLVENNPQMTGLRSLTCFVPDLSRPWSRSRGNCNRSAPPKWNGVFIRTFPLVYSA